MGWLIVLIILPIVWCFICYLLWKIEYQINLTEIILLILVMPISVGVLYYYGIHKKMDDKEILNGKIISKKKEKGSYRVSYKCGDSTCHTTHYTVTWFAKTNVDRIGRIQFKHLDWTSPAVYLVPDPKPYKNCIIGESASVEKTFSNYIKAIPESLFYEDKELKNKYTKNIPTYPKVHDFYKINRIVNVGSVIKKKEISELNTDLNNELQTLGNKKQVNIIVVLTGIDDQKYKYAVENSWLGGKKNDVVVFVGLNGNKILWADAMTWAKNKGNELFNVKTRDAIKDIKTFNNKKFESVVISSIIKYYKRPQMSEFSYLKSDIQPSTTITIFIVLLSIFGSLLTSFMFHHDDSPDPIREWLERQ